MTEIAMIQWRTSSLSYRRRLQPLKEKINQFKTVYFLTVFFFVCVIFAHLDPNLDPADQNQCESMRIRIHNTDENDKKAVIIGIGYKMTGKQSVAGIIGNE